MIDFDKLLLGLSFLEGDFSKGTSVFPIIEEVNIMPLSDLAVMRHRFMDVGVTFTFESIIAVGTECEHSSCKCADES